MSGRHKTLNLGEITKELNAAHGLMFADNAEGQTVIEKVSVSAATRWKHPQQFVYPEPDGQSSRFTESGRIKEPVCWIGVGILNVFLSYCH